MSYRRDERPLDAIDIVLLIFTLIALMAAVKVGHSNFFAGVGLFVGVLVLSQVLAILATGVRMWRQARKRCPHGVRAGLREGCQVCATDAMRDQAQRVAEEERRRQRQELHARAYSLRGQEIERLSRAWLSNTEAYLQMGPQEFENAIAELFRKLGYQVKQTPYSNDGGKDAIAEKNGEKILIECKRYAANNSIGRRDLQILVAAMHDEGAGRGIYVNTGIFTATAKKYAEKNEILLYDRNTLPQLINEAYPTPADVSHANVMCVECGAITPMSVCDLPATGVCRNGHALTSNVVKADLRVFSSTGIPNCEICGSPMRVVKGRRGEFWGCSRYPRCRSTKPIVEAVRTLR
jgi:hypothetical protein